MSQSSDDSFSDVCLTPDSSSQASSIAPASSNNRPQLLSDWSTNACWTDYAKHPGPRNRTASIDLWSADIADLGMKLAQFDEHNPPSVRSGPYDPMTELHAERGRSRYFFSKCQDLLKLIRESKEIIKELSSRVEGDSSLVSRITDERWACEQKCESLTRSLAWAEGRLRLERQWRDELEQESKRNDDLVKTLEESLETAEERIAAVLKSYNNAEKEAEKDGTLIYQLSKALEAQNKELHVAIKMAEKVGGWHEEVLNNIREAMGVGVSEGFAAIESWEVFLAEHCAGCKLDPDVGDTKAVLEKVRVWYIAPSGSF